MKKVFVIVVFFIFYYLSESRSATLELRSLTILNRDGQVCRENKIGAGQSITLQMIYVQRGFSKKAKILFKIFIYDQKGEEILKDQVVHAVDEGEKTELYHLQVPANASGPYLIVLTVKALESKKIYAKITKKLPLLIEPGRMSSS